MARTDPQVNFRIPAELKDKLDQAAKENGRTLTTELILRLETTFQDNDQSNSLINRISNLEDIVAKLEVSKESLIKRISTLEKHTY